MSEFLSYIVCLRVVDLIALVLLLYGLPWLVYVGYRRGGPVWAILIFFFSLIAGLIFCIVKKSGWVPWFFIFVAWLLVIAGRLHWV